MLIQKNIPLASFTTFRIGGKVDFFAEVTSIEELEESMLFAKTNNIPFFVLGGGSNVLISDKGFKGLVIKISFKGTSFIEKENDVFVQSGAGEVWDSLVSTAVLKNLWGIENLSAIPGTVGAAPVQNIGAYGGEFQNTFFSLQAFNVQTKEIKEFTKEECLFGYRDSIFKKKNNPYVIISVTLKLSKIPRINILYKDVQTFFLERNTMEPSLQEIRDAVVEIRKNKLPDITKLGTAGSFFKNPIITKDKYGELKKEYPELPFFEVNETHVKIPLAWVLDTVCKLKGFKMGSVGLYEHQPLALVNFGNGNEKEITALAEYVSRKVKEKINVDIEWEVQRIV